MGEQNALITKFESAYGMVELTPETVTRYLKRGNSELTEQEIRLFIELCKFQKLNPFVGEAYAIKFGNDFQMVIGYDTYKRRAEENPSYRGRKSGIVVQRGDAIIQKEGTCLYPKETLIGGWCRVYRQLNDRDIEEYKEVSLSEYQKMKDGRPQANWASKPCTMIEKVAVSQALRAAFPKDFSGLYTEDEMPVPQQEQERSGSVSARPVKDVTNTVPAEDTPADERQQLISKDQRKELIDLAVLAYGAKDGVAKIKELCAKYGFQSSQEVTIFAYQEIIKVLNEELDRKQAEDYTVE